MRGTGFARGLACRLAALAMAAGVLLAPDSSARASTIASEDFSGVASPPTDLASVPVGDGTGFGTNAWANFAGPKHEYVAAGNLTYTDSGSNVYASTGPNDLVLNAGTTPPPISGTATNNSVYIRKVTATLSAQPFWVGFLINKSAATSSTNDYGFLGIGGQNSANFGNVLGIGDGGSGFWSIQNTNNGTPINSTAAIVRGTTAFLVVKVTPGGGTAGNDLAQFFANPSLTSADPSGGSLTTGVILNNLKFVTGQTSQIGFQTGDFGGTGTPPAYTVADVALGTNYSDVIAANTPEPASIAFLVLGAAQLMVRRRVR